jgi:murein DD-endopeptidase MepM/ murein hydrolase activator NlpD
MSLARTGRLSALGACVLVAAAVSGCGFGASPRLVIRDPQVPSETAQSAPARPEAAAGTGGTTPAPSAVVAPGVILVGGGETLYTIARARKVALRDLIDTNGLVAPYDLHPGQRLRLPPRHDHVVAPGDTVYGISRQYDVDMTSLVRLNELQPPYTIAVGQRLRIPAPTVTIAAPQTMQTMAAAPAAAIPEPQGAAVAQAPAAQAPAAQTGAGTETLATVEVETLPPLPPSKPGEAAPGQATPEPSGLEQASVQPTGPTPPAPLPKPSEAKLSEASPAQQLPAQPSPPDEAAAGARVAAVEPAAAGANVAVAVPPPVSGGPSFSWPLRGAIVSSFGSKKGGEHNDGINIAARRGAPVRAAEDGIVVYAGNELRGFGNLVLIRHADGWTTAYAHNETLLVKRGDRVRRGQVIAKAGSSGSVATPQLHFEIRRGRRAVDPAEYLTAAAGPSVSISPVAARDGRRGPE